MRTNGTPTETSRTRITPLQKDQIPQVGDVLADSHANYPAFAHLFPDPDRRQTILRSFFTGVARDAQPFGAVRVAMSGERMLGAAVWLPPRRFPWSAWRKLRATGSFLPVLWQAPRRARDFFALGANTERAAPDGPHWNLQVLGVRGEAQGGGLGTRLLEPVLSQAETEGEVCYLETADPANVAFYERLGFALVRKHQLLLDGPAHYAMQRHSR